MNDKQLFCVKIPERPTGKTIAVCFESLISQMVANESMSKEVSRLRINKETKRIETEVKEA